MSEERQTAGQVDLGPLKQRYDIIGELRGSEAAQMYVGRRREGGDAAEVVIMVAKAPPGDQSNSLSHFAADTRLLSTLNHPGLARVLDGMWLGDNAFARVIQRIRGTPLAQRMSAGERFANPRIATVLQDVHGVLDWARSHGVVHRGVTPDTLFFEPGAEHVCMFFAPMPIPMSGVPDACADARTTGTLAWEMLSGKRVGESPDQSLGQLAPDLASRVVDATEGIVHCKAGDPTPDVLNFLSIIATGDVLKQAEVEMAALKDEYDEQHQAELQKCESQRAETEHHAMEQAAILAGEREEFERHMADERAAIAAERAEFESAAAERQRRLAAVREELDQQRGELERRLGELEAYRVDVERLRAEATAAAAAARAATAESVASAAKAANAAKAASATGGPAAAASSSPVRAAVPAKPPAPPVKRREVKRQEKKLDRILTPDLAQPVVADSNTGWPAWLLPAVAVFVALVLLVVGLGIAHRRHAASNTVAIGKSTIVPTTPTTQSGIIPTGGFLTQSAGGALSPRFSGSPLVRPSDSTAAPSPAASAGGSAQAAADSSANFLAPPKPVNQTANAAHALTARPKAEVPKPTRQITTPADQATQPTPAPEPAVRDTTAASRPVPKRDTVVARDSVPRRDTAARRDTLVRRDTTVRRDTLPRRPDTTATRP